MGCDIHSFAEKRNEKTGKWEKLGDVFTLEEVERKYYDNKKKCDEPFRWRSYSLFAFLADVRNYDCCEPISSPRGLPTDSERLNEEVGNDYFGGGGDTRKEQLEDGGFHSHSYLTAKELLDFDYDKVFWNRRISRTTYNENGCSFTDGAALAQEGEGKNISYRENLGESFFVLLEQLKSLGNPEDIRVVFYFDN